MLMANEGGHPRKMRVVAKKGGLQADLNGM
jgi:hypothetical protein